MKARSAYKLSDFDYKLPDSLIATSPVEPRDHARLLVLDRKTKTINHQRFDDIVGYFNSGDVLVLNNSKVIPARLHGTKASGGRVEIFLIKKTLPHNITPPLQQGRNPWTVLIKGKVSVGSVITLAPKITAIIKNKDEDGTCEVIFNVSDKKLFALGETPLPPYIHNTVALKDYQTVYAKSEGSVAAPTAGLHFTKRLMTKLERKGVKIVYVTLHVGLGTFQPVRTENITDHQMHSEWAEISKTTAKTINAAKKKGCRIIACGTTAVRTLESFAITIPSSPPVKSGDLHLKLDSGSKWTNIFMYPGYQFKIVDGMITNFHLPKSSLIMLVSAFAGYDLTMKTYETAIKNKYRFYSFGDAMLIA